MISDIFLAILSYFLKLLSFLLPKIDYVIDLEIPEIFYSSAGFVSGFFPLGLAYSVAFTILSVELAFLTIRAIIWLMKFTPFIKTDHLSKK